MMLLGNLLKLAELVINKGVDINNVLKLFLWMIPYLLSYVLPISALTATLLALGRLSSDNEIIAIKSSGINLFNLILPLLIIGLILSAILVVFNDRVIPYSHFASRRILMDVGLKNPAAAIEPGVFINSFEKYIIFVYRVEENRLSNIRIYEPRTGNPPRTIVAKHGEFISLPETKTIKLKLIDGTSDEPDPKNPNNFYKMNFKQYFMSLSLSQNDNKKIEKKAKDMTLQELKIEVEKLKKKGIDPTPLITEINKRVALALSTFIFVLLGSSVAVFSRRREKSFNFAISFVIIGAYYLLSLAAETLSLQGLLNPNLAMWLPNLVFGLVGSILLYRVCAC